MASLDRQVTQNGPGVINAMQGEYTMVKVVNVESLEKLSDGVVDVEPFLVSRNTLGNGKTANSKSQRPNVKCQMVVAGCGGGCGSSMGLRKCNDGFLRVGNAEVEGKVVNYTRCQGWKHVPK